MFPQDPELFEERAAIMEHDGELSREEAERQARIIVYGAGTGTDPALFNTGDDLNPYHTTADEPLTAALYGRNTRTAKTNPRKGPDHEHRHSNR